MRTLVVLMLFAVVVTGCGKKGRLIYPEMLVPAASSNVVAQQFGDSIKLSFVLPSRDRAGRSLAALAGVTILKRDEPVTQKPGCSDCIADYSLFRKLNLDLLSPGVQRYGNLLVLLDGSVQAGRTYSYRFTAVDKDGQEGALSAPVTAEMVPTLLPPVLQAISQPTEIQLEVVGLPPREGVIIGYNLYRSQKGEAFSFVPMNLEIVIGNRYVDIGLERGTTYIYGARTVMMLPSGNRVESSLSNEVEGKLKDDE